ncbi:MAG: cysteine desulfurase [Alphaproteobacteria bacterium]|nr:cysteine desulfurase [Alphaproteobacteria bacterium]
MTAAHPVYLDYNATAPIKPAVVAAMAEVLGRVGNPSSVHAFGRAARRAVEGAREQVATLVGAAPAQVIFTASGTEANNLALRGFPERAVLTSTIEHESVLRAVPDAARVPVAGDGVIDLATLETLLIGAGRPALVSIMLANNETGIVQPIAAAAEIAHRHGALLHTDAVQAPGRLDLELTRDADLVTVSAHKCGGPQGAAALIARTDPKALLVGGGQERGRRAGTENVAALVGFGVAAELAVGELAEAPSIARLRDALESKLRALSNKVVVVGAAVPRLPNTSCLALPGRKAETQLMALDLAGVAVSAGSACSSGKVAASHVLAAMGLPKGLTTGAIRVSLGWATRDGDVERFVAAWEAMQARAAAP